MPALNEFKKIYPEIELDVMLTDEVVNIMREGIDLVSRGAPEYSLQYGSPKSPADLCNHQWVIYKLTSGVVTLTKGRHLRNST